MRYAHRIEVNLRSGSEMVIPEILARGIKSEIPGFPLKTMPE